MLWGKVFFHLFWYFLTENSFFLLNFKFSFQFIDWTLKNQKKIMLSRVSLWIGHSPFDGGSLKSTIFVYFIAHSTYRVISDIFLLNKSLKESVFCWKKVLIKQNILLTLHKYIFRNVFHLLYHRILDIHFAHSYFPAELNN